VPFKSQAQRRKFYALKAQGKMDQKTIDEWEAETPKKLPDRISTKTGAEAMNFWLGFDKRAAETYLQAKEPTLATEGANLGAVPPEKMLKWNEQGGVDPRSPEDLQAASGAGLITLPEEVEGASCGTCVHFRALNPELGSGFCTNPAIKQDVTNRMLCSQWEHPGSYSAAQQMEEDAALQQQADEQAAMAGQGVADGDPMAQNIMSDFQGGTGGAGGAPPGAEEVPMEGAPMEEGMPPGGEPAPAPKPKKSKPKEGDKKTDNKGNTINIHVGKEKVATDAFLAGFVGRMR
jgi:hypothetical protein